MRYNSDILSHAIVVRAAEDYRKALKKRKKDKARDLEKWFLSDWGQALSGGCGELIIEKIKKEMQQNGKRKSQKNVTTKSAL
jgi:hypothetical protein